MADKITKALTALLVALGIVAVAGLGLYFMDDADSDPADSVARDDGTPSEAPEDPADLPNLPTPTDPDLELEGRLPPDAPAPVSAETWTAMSDEEKKAHILAVLASFGGRSDPRDHGMHRIEIRVSSEFEFAMAPNVTIVLAENNVLFMEAEMKHPVDNSTMQAELYCGADGYTFVYNGEAFAKRPPGSFTRCLIGDEGDPASMSAMFSSIGLPGDPSQQTFAVRGNVITIQDDLWATEIVVDGQGRPLSIDAVSELSRAQIEITQVPQAAIEIPAATARLPTNLVCDGFVDGVRFESRCALGGEPLAEFEIRVMTVGRETILASFPATGGSTQEQGAFTLELTENGDGLFGEGDTISVIGIQPEKHEVVVWDLWADRAVDDHDMPAPGLVLVALALLVACVCMQNRRA